ncbi:unnamed protein product [Miscanthus lutarioriparius]|uniref:Methyltransferase type 11 domain-containing protein n=1 Tax=Miscanthus lutarioriparius TaxID=422564 RepID=A0A811R601_9POAL|nr:unnamed protein product [Miscanthus lutarioriparius]
MLTLDAASPPPVLYSSLRASNLRGPGLRHLSQLPMAALARRPPPQQLPRRRAATIGTLGATSRRAVTGLPRRGGLTCAPAPHLPSPLPTYPTKLSRDASSLECSTCKKFYPNKQDYWDLTVSVGSTEYSESMPAATELFRTPLVSFLYERGWRQNFIWGGFPGLEREFEMAKTYLKPTFGGTIVDASCGSGLFSRLFVKSGLYSLVVALDFSENMLKQCNECIKQENISDEYAFDH